MQNADIAVAPGVEPIALFAEDWESVEGQLRPFVSPSESGGDDTDWTPVPPVGWTVDNATPAGGPVEFHGWTFLDKQSWIATAEDQQRSGFIRGQGLVAVADADEYDDVGSIEPDQFSARLTSPEIGLGAAAGQSVYLNFDSSWRPEDLQQARVLVSFDGADPVEILNWTSDPASADFHPDATNERVVIPLLPPEGAQSARITFDMPRAGNDWWWAVDNITVTAGAPAADNAPPVDEARVLDFIADNRYQVSANLSSELTSYTMVWDVMAPAGQAGSYGALLQTDLSNGSDAELFLYRHDDGSYGIGISGQYDGSIQPGDWARVVMSVTDLGTGLSRIDKYIDGVLVGTQQEDASRFKIPQDGKFLIMTDNDGETFSGKLASFSVLGQSLDTGTVAAMGKVAPGGAFVGAPGGVDLVQFDFGGDSAVQDGRAFASIGTGAIIDRSVEVVSVEEQILHRLMSVGETVEIDLAEVFSGDDLTYGITASDGAPVDARIVDGKLVMEGLALGFSDYRLTATDVYGNSISDDFRVRVAGDKAYSFVVLPDTQNYTEAHQYIFGQMTQFLAANKDSLKLQIVTHVGDVTGSNLLPEWQIVSDAYKALEDAGLPYTLLPGNHDQGVGGTASDHSTNQTQFFDPDRYFADSQDRPHGVYDGEPDSTANNFKTFTAPDGTDWIVLSMEFGPRDDVMRWANDVLTEHSGHRAIVLTHHYTNMADIAGPNSGDLYNEGTGKNYGMVNGAEGMNDGRDIWDQVLSKHGNVSFILSGHVFGDGAETIIRHGEQGNPVFQMFVNYQNGVAKIIQSAGIEGEDGRGGNGAMRILTVDPDNDQLHTETYYAHLDRFMTGARGDADPSREGSGVLEPVERVIQPLEFGSTAGFGLAVLPVGDDGSAEVARLPHFNADNGLKVLPGFDAGTDSGLYPAYTLVWDVHIPGGIGLSSILQTEMDNISDGDLWVQGDGSGAGKIGGDGQDDGPFPLNDWSRITMVFERVEDGLAWRADKYVDGVLMGSQIFEGDRRVVNESGFLLFGDDGMETPNGWFFSSFAMIDTALTATEVADLAEVSLGGPFATLPDGATHGVQFNVENGALVTTLGTGTISQEIGSTGELSLTGRYLEHQETFDGIDLGAVDATFRAEAGQDVKVDLSLTDRVTLDGSNLTDRQGQVARAEWLDASGRVIADTLVAEVAAQGGAHRYALQVSDGEGRISTDDLLVVGIDERTLMFDSFNDRSLDGWTATGNWLSTGAAHSAGGTAEAYLRKLPGAEGMILWDSGAAWSNYTVTAEIENENPGTTAVIAYASEVGHYALEILPGDHLVRLVRVEGDQRTVLAEQADGMPYDRVAGGTVGFAEDANNRVTRFDNISVRNVVDLSEPRAATSPHDDAPSGKVIHRDDFSVDTGAWQFVDEGELGEAAAWVLDGGKLVQTANRYSYQLMGEGDTAPDNYWKLDWSPLGDGYHVLRKGTYALLESPEAAALTDFSVEVDFSAPSGGAAGLLFNYADARNHLKLELDRNGGMSQLVAVEDGIEEILWQEVPNYDQSGTNTLRLEVQDNTISAWLDGWQIFAPISTAMEPNGTVALYNWGAPGTGYDNFSLISLDDGSVLNRIDGSSRADRITGTDGGDEIHGNGGNDRIEGGAGADIFVFSTLTDDRREVVTILDFDVTQDRLDLQGAAIASQHQTGSGLLLRLQSGDILRLDGVTLDDTLLFV